MISLSCIVKPVHIASQENFASWLLSMIIIINKLYKLIIKYFIILNKNIKDSRFITSYWFHYILLLSMFLELLKIHESSSI